MYLYIRMCVHSGLVPITNGMGTVNLTGLICAVEYTIIAEGTLDGELVGPRSNYTASADSRRCPEDMTSTTTATVLMTGKGMCIFRIIIKHSYSFNCQIF